MDGALKLAALKPNRCTAAQPVLLCGLPKPRLVFTQFIGRKHSGLLRATLPWSWDGMRALLPAEARQHMAGAVTRSKLTLRLWGGQQSPSTQR